MIEKKHWVKVSNEEVSYIENHFKHARCKMVKIKGKNYDMNLTYNESDSEKVSQELQILEKHKIIERVL